MTIRPAPTRTAVVAVLTLLVAACGGDDATGDPVPGTTVPRTTVPGMTVPGTTVPATTVPATTGPDPTTTEARMPDDQPPEVRTAIADLVARTGTDPAEVTVAAFESVTWRDGSIGCPEPGMNYTQALVPGYRIELVVAGVSHWYHGARDREPFWCATPSEPADGRSPDT